MQSVLELVSDAVLVVDSAGVVRSANDAAGRLLAVAPAGLIGRVLAELVSERSRPAFAAMWDDARTGGSAQIAAAGAISFVRADGRTTPVELALARFEPPGRPEKPGELAIAVVMRGGSGPEQDSLIGQLTAAQRAQRFLLDAATVMMDASGFRETLRALAAIAVPSLGDVCLIDVFDERGELARVAAAHNDPAHAELVDELRRAYPPDASGSHPSVRAMRERQTLWSRDISEDFLRLVTRDRRHLEILRALRVSGYLCVPLVAGEEVLGCLSTLSGPSGRKVSADDVSLAEQLARQVAQVIAKERRYDAARASSHTLQASLLPADVPRVDGLDIAVRYVPGTRDAEVGGDFWDVSELPSGKVSLSIGDVAGHDVVAATTMAQLRSVCRALRPATGSPADLVDALQRTWDQLALARVATAAFAELDVATGAVRIASAGHPPPILVGGEACVAVDVDPAPPLGAVTTAASNWVGVLPAGGALVFYTDGLVEDRYRDLDDGLRRLIRTAIAAPVTDAAELAERLLTCIPDDDRSDDVALLVVRRTR